MAAKVLQANINHCAAAQDLLQQSMAQWLIEVAVVAEPYFVPPSGNWIGDVDGLVAIVGSTNIARLSTFSTGRGYVAVYWREYILIGIYFSPNKSRAEFEAFLDGIGTLIEQNHPRPALIVGDFNAKSIAWGSPATDARGGVLEEWASVIGLTVLNRGTINTCVRHNGGSIVDLSFASPIIARRVHDWRVIENVETLSDHLYIRFSISTSSDGGSTRQLNGQPSSAPPRWALASLDQEAAIVASIAQSWVIPQQGLLEVNEEADWFRRALSHICDAAMSRAKPRPPRRQVYWWSAEISSLRSACIVARRQYTRHMRRRLRDRELDEPLHATYRQSILRLKIAISEAKKRAKAEMLASLSVDPWGRPYKLVRNKLRKWAPPLTESLQPQLLEEIISTLFPSTVEYEPPDMGSSGDANEDNAAAPPISDGEFRAAVLKLRGKRKAPGPDGVPGCILVTALQFLGDRLRQLFDACLGSGCVPSIWKIGRLVLIRKEGQPESSPSAYRPIVVLDEVDKLFERNIAGRLIGHLNDSGPNLSDSQFGFRVGRSTIDAILRVKDQAERAVAHGGVMLAVSLDISNAFNTLPWVCISEALKFHAVPSYLRRIVEAYLSERFIEYPARDHIVRKTISRGVPQGSVLGPLLWNIGFDWILRGSRPLGAEVVCYADDTLITAKGNTFEEAAELITQFVGEVLNKIRLLGLAVSLGKTQAIGFHGPYRAPPRGLTILVGNTRVTVESQMKYLGLVLDSKWNFQEHFIRLAPRLTSAANALKRLLPNIGGPSCGTRRLYMGVIRSMALYGAPVWAEALSSKTSPYLRRPQRIMTVGVVRGYRTISYEAACLLAASPPWDLEAELYASCYQWRVELRLRGEHPTSKEIDSWIGREKQTLLSKWGVRLLHPQSGKRTVEAIRPFLKEWIDREHGSLSFRLVQVLSGHGCFGKYLHRIAGREPTPACHHCGCVEDTAEHTLGECPAWASERRVLVTAVGGDLSLPTMVRAMVGSEMSWRAVRSFCEEVISRKEAAERERELTSALAIRQRRVGRRGRIPHALLQPP